MTYSVPFYPNRRTLPVRCSRCAKKIRKVSLYDPPSLSTKLTQLLSLCTKCRKLTNTQQELPLCPPKKNR